VINQHASGTSTPMSHAVIFPIDGAYQDVGVDDTAWGGSRSGYVVFIIGLATTPDLVDAERTWVRSLWQALLAHASGIGGYVNSLAQREDDRVRAPTDRPNTGDWPGSTRSTIQTTSSTAMPISNQRSQWGSPFGGLAVLK
jgi:hypothetical protein